jgi:hypothetical protein
MMSISNRILSGIFILSVFESESGHKYENKYDISDIRPYSIRFHPYLYAHLQIHVLSEEWAWGLVRDAGSRWCGRKIGLEREDSVGTHRRWVCSITVRTVTYRFIQRPALQLLNLYISRTGPLTAQRCG